MISEHPSIRGTTITATDPSDGSTGAYFYINAGLIHTHFPLNMGTQYGGPAEGRPTEGTIEIMIMLHNAAHGVLLIEVTLSNSHGVQIQCPHLQVIIVVSNGKHCITYHRKNSCLAEDTERTRELPLRPLVDPEIISDQDTDPLANQHKIRLAILSRLPDQQQYEEPSVTW
jgi:hypothetical protein